MEGLSKILNMCSQNGFFHATIANGLPTSVVYGPLGSLLRRNIKREWLSSAVNETNAHIFPLEAVSGSQPKQLPQLAGTADMFLLPDVLQNYFKILPSLGYDIPYGFAAYGSDFGKEQNSVYFDELITNSVLRKLESRHWLCVFFFCSPKTSSDWFNYWSRHRYRWWRKFSCLPSKFSMSEVTETETNDQQLALMMDFPWGKEKLETVTLLEGKSFDEMCLHLNLKNEREEKLACSPSIIVCQSELDMAAFAYLTNSFTEKWRNGKMRQLFQLHVKLAPYKVAVSLNTGASDMKKLKDVGDYLEKELKKSQVMVFPGSSKDISSQFKRLDEMGVPYIIVLDNKALQSGVASLRNRDSTLEEQVHITEMTMKLSRYLQMKSLQADGC